MLRTAAPVHATIDRSACPSRGGHGTRHHRYANGCTCPDALEHNRRNWWGLRYGEPMPETFVPAVGTARRLQAAAVRGWSAREIAERVGVQHQRITRLRGAYWPRVKPDTANRIARVVDALHREPPPQDQNSGNDGARSRIARTRAHAARQGWVALDEWLPDEIDDPVALPDSAYRRGDQTADPTSIHVMRELRDDLDLSHDAIARLTGVDAETVAERLEAAAQAQERRGPGTRRRLSADDAYAIRREYLARGDGWTMARCAARWGVSAATVSDLIHGHIRPELGLNDLTAHQRGDTPAGTPTPGTTRKESAA